MSEPDFYKTSGPDHNSVQDTVERAKLAAEDLEQAYQRWNELESMKTAS